KTATRVQRVLHNDESVEGVLLENGEEIEAKKVILDSGGKSVPKTGSTGDGYIRAKEYGHTIAELYATEVPLTSDEAFIKKKSLQGLSLGDVALTAWTPKNKARKTHRWDMIFNDLGISGPAALRLGQSIVKAIKKCIAKS